MDQHLYIAEKNSGNAICRISRRRSRALQLDLCCLLLCSVVFVADCGKTPIKPAEFTVTDVCFGCKAPIAVKSYAAEFITSNGFVRKFDDFACLAANAKKVGRKNIVAIYAVDAETQKLFPIEQLQLLHSDRFVSPKKSGILAFQNPAKADSVAAQFKAEKVKLDDLLK